MQYKKATAGHSESGRPAAKRDAAQAAPQTLLRLCSEAPGTQEQQEQGPWQARHRYYLRRGKTLHRHGLHLRRPSWKAGSDCSEI